MKITYRVISKVYDLVDVFYFTERGNNPRKAILKCIPKEQVRLIDMCCGTLSNSLQIAKVYQQAEIIGIDISDGMLAIAKEKIKKANLRNIKVLQGDATSTGIVSESADIIILGLVLHEVEEDLAKQVLREAYRLLKKDGKLIVLEWEKSQSFLKRLWFMPIKWMEPKSFKVFFERDKESYFAQHHFKRVNEIHCDYSCVYELIKV